MRLSIAEYVFHLEHNSQLIEAPKLDTLKLTDKAIDSKETNGPGINVGKGVLKNQDPDTTSKKQAIELTNEEIEEFMCKPVPNQIRPKQHEVESKAQLEAIEAFGKSNI